MREHYARTVAGLMLLVAAAGLAEARTSGKPWRPARIYDHMWHEPNQWRITLTNYGTFGYGIGSSGGEWPGGSGEMYIYGAGIWIGSLRRGAAGRDTLVSCGYNPNSGRSEMTPGCYENAPGGYSSREFERVYVYPGDWPPDIGEFPADLHDSTPTPLRIPSGEDTIRGYFHYIPRSAVSTGDAWTVFNDRDPENHVAGSSPRPLGIEGYQSVYAWTLPWNRDIVFFKLDIRNRSEDTLRDVYLGMVCDADVGNATDDMCGLALAKYIYSPDGADSVYVDNMGYVWSDDGVPAGLVGFDFLQSPYVRNPDGSIDGFDGLDNNANGLIDEPAEGRQLGMRSFKIFTLTDADPQDDVEQYLALAGHDYWDPQRPYNPYDSTDAAPADKRFLQGTGPFTLAPGEMATVTIGVIAANRAGDDPVTMPYYLAQASRAAQAAYDNNWIMPEPPPSPTLTSIPGDGRVTLLWDDMPESARDRFYPVAPALLNPYYVEQDFQGYKIYRSRSGRPGEWTLLTQCDRMDGVVYEDTVAAESIRTRATDAGLTYSYVDSSDLRLGFPYYYAVTSFDVNYLGSDPDSLEILSLESGISALRVVPRTQAENYRAPAADWDQVAGPSDLRAGVAPFPVTPHAVATETYRVQFTGVEYEPARKIPLYPYLVVNSVGDTVIPTERLAIKLDSLNDTFRFAPTVFDSVITLIERNVGASGDTTIDTTRAWLPVVQMAMWLQMEQIPLQSFSRVEVVSGDYPADSISVPAVTNNPGLWAYRGSDYRLVWRTHTSGRLTCEVYDLDNEVAVSYRSFGLRGEPDSADGWCFRSLRDAGDTLGPGQTRWMYICGSQFAIQRGNPISLLPAPGDTWLVRSRTLSPAPGFAAFRVSFTAMAFADSSTKLDVKVVPNPYLVRNEWERHPDFRKLRFVNLPNKCTIRIYNLAGDLVRTLEHDETNPRVGGIPNQYGGDEDWDLLNESRQKPAPGIYLFHVESDIGQQVGKFVLIY